MQFSPSDLAQLGSAFDIITEADEAAEKSITSRLNSCFPDAVVVGEEAADRDPELLQALGSSELAFVVDPLDGTKNFASGLLALAPSCTLNLNPL